MQVKCEVVLKSGEVAEMVAIAARTARDSWRGDVNCEEEERWNAGERRIAVDSYSYDRLLQCCVSGAAAVMCSTRDQAGLVSCQLFNPGGKLGLTTLYLYSVQGWC